MHLNFAIANYEQKKKKKKKGGGLFHPPWKHEEKEPRKYFAFKMFWHLIMVLTNIFELLLPFTSGSYKESGGIGELL